MVIHGGQQPDSAKCRWQLDAASISIVLVSFGPAQGALRMESRFVCGRMPEACPGVVLSLSWWGELGSVGEAEVEARVVGEVLVVVGPGEGAGEDDGGLVGGAWALAGVGHVLEGSLELGFGQRGWVEGSEVGGRAIAATVGSSGAGCWGGVRQFGGGRGSRRRGQLTVAAGAPCSTARAAVASFWSPRMRR